VSHRIRLALLTLVVLACVLARVGGALGAQLHTVKHGRTRRARVLSHATAVARREVRVVRFARRFVGVRYVYGGASPRTGFDCSGFTRFVYSHFGIALPHYSVAQFSMGRRISRRGLRAGDLVFFDGIGHVGMYIGGGRFIHAPHTGTRVSVDSLNGWYGSRYDGARRLL
jgi:cell wall-associated NlpC family hydrolase